MINKITLAKIASYKDEASLETDKKVNLIYGLNGSGKTVFSNYLENLEGEHFVHCSIEGFKKDEQKILVYNQSFVEKNFYETERQKGIFTLAKDNAIASQKIKEAESEKKNMIEEREKLKENLDKNETESEKNKDNAKDETWKIKTEYTGGDRIFDKAGFLDKLKANKDTLFDYLINLPLIDSSRSIEDIKFDLLNISEEATERERLTTINRENFSKVEKDEIFQKEIVGNENSSIAGLIKELGNSDWVKKGIDEYVDLNQRGNCPFCQEKTLTDELVADIKNYFDEAYEKDLGKIKELYESYKNLKKNFILNEYKKDFFTNEQNLQMEKHFGSLSKVIDGNLKLLDQKIKQPSSPINLSSSANVIEDMNKFIESVNRDITEFNEKIKNKKEEQRKLKKEFWNILRKKYDSIIEFYIKEKKGLDQKKEEIKTEIKSVSNSIEEKKRIIGEWQKKVVNIGEVVEKINQHLLDFGIQDFKIVKYSDREYNLKRNTDDNKTIFKSLSEGEKTVISFLYFIELCVGKEETDDTKNKIIVIDDPISSLSHMYVFNVAELIKRIFLKGTEEAFIQVFVLTHNLYFFHELIDKNKKNDNNIQGLFRISKSQSSTIEKMKKNEIQNEYQSYWAVIKSGNQDTMFLVANSMRNIIEYFFGFIDKSESINNLFQREELNGPKYSAFKRYIDRESHTDPPNISDYKERNLEHFKEVFKKVFEVTGYKEHYEKMMQ